MSKNIMKRLFQKCNISALKNAVLIMCDYYESYRVLVWLEKNPAWLFSFWT